MKGRLVNAYFLFSQDYREKVKGENPGIKGKDLIQILSNMWKNADEETKKYYHDRQLN